MRKPLPLKQWLALEEDVARHKAEIAQGFAEARARLLPEPKRWSPSQYTQAALAAEAVRWQMAPLGKVGFRDPTTGALVWFPQDDDASRRGLLGLGFLGL